MDEQRYFQVNVYLVVEAQSADAARRDVRDLLPQLREDYDGPVVEVSVGHATGVRWTA